MNKKVFLMAFAASILVATPCLAADKNPLAQGALGLLSVLLYNYAPWITGFILDIGISKMSVKVLRSVMTATLSMVLGYPSIFFSFTAFVAPGGPDSMLAWALASSFVSVALGTVKVVAYWVVNEAFPNKKVAALLYVNAMIMVAVSFGVLKLMK